MNVRTDFGVMNTRHVLHGVSNTARIRRIVEFTGDPVHKPGWACVFPQRVLPPLQGRHALGGLATRFLTVGSAFATDRNHPNKSFA